jgi:hypothetical protein
MNAIYVTDCLLHQPCDLAGRSPHRTLGGPRYQSNLGTPSARWTPRGGRATGLDPRGPLGAQCPTASATRMPLRAFLWGPYRRDGGAGPGRALTHKTM